MEGITSENLKLKQDLANVHKTLVEAHGLKSFQLNIKCAETVELLIKKGFKVFQRKASWEPFLVVTHDETNYDGVLIGQYWPVVLEGGHLIGFAAGADNVNRPKTELTEGLVGGMVQHHGAPDLGGRGYLQV